MRYPSKMRISSAKNKYNKFDLSRDQITTSNFSVPLVSYCKEVVPGDNFNLKMESLVRLTPMVNPTFGRITLSHRFFFVPMRSIYRDWLSFINQVPVSRDRSTFMHSKVPHTKMSFIIEALENELFSERDVYDPSAEVPEAPDPDADWISHVNDIYYNNYFTPIGRKVYNLLLNLGYNLDFSSASVGADKTQLVSLLPILAYFKVYLNFYYPSQYDVNQYDWLFERTSSTAYTLGDIITLLGLVADAVSYDPDYFVSSWDNPTSPSSVAHGSGSLINPTRIDDITVSGQNSSFVNNTLESTPVLQGHQGTTDYINPRNPSSYILHMLDKVQDYVTRNQIAGYRPIDRFLSRFGVRLDYKETNRALYLGGSTFPIQISEVTSQSETFDRVTGEGAPLGYQGGKGVGYGTSENIDFKSPEFGYIICVSSITPHIGYYQGTVRENQHLEPLDFYTPEFDGAGVQAISLSEVFNSLRSHIQYSEWTADDLSHDSIFGFVPRFSEYKVGNDVLSGDFRNPRNKNSYVGYHLMREIADEFDYDPNGDFVDESKFYHDPDFVMQTDNADYLRIFSNKSVEADHFVLINHAEVHATRPMLSIIDGVEFYDRHHNDNKDIEVTNNGATFN